MTNKFKVGDVVVVNKELKHKPDCEWFYHENPMKIIGFNKFYYFTYYWNKNDKLSFEDNMCNGTTEECLQFCPNWIREKKLKRICNWS